MRPNIGMQFAFTFRALADRHAEILVQLDGEGLKPSQAYVLHAVAEHPRSVSQLSDLMQVSKQAMSQMVEQLQQRGLLSRRVNDSDRRARDVGITAAGLHLLDLAETAWRTVETEVAEVIGEPAFASLRDALETYRTSRPAAPSGEAPRPVW